MNVSGFIGQRSSAPSSAVPTAQVQPTTMASAATDSAFERTSTLNEASVMTSEQPQAGLTRASSDAGFSEATRVGDVSFPAGVSSISARHPSDDDFQALALDQTQFDQTTHDVGRAFSHASTDYQQPLHRLSAPASHFAYGPSPSDNVMHRNSFEHAPAHSFQAASFNVPQYYSLPHPHTQHTFAPPYNDVTSWHLRHQEQLRRQAAPAQVHSVLVSTSIRFSTQIIYYVFVNFVSVFIRLAHYNHFGRSTKSRLVATRC